MNLNQVQDITVNHQQLIDINTGKTITKNSQNVLHGYENTGADQYIEQNVQKIDKPCIKNATAPAKKRRF